MTAYTFQCNEENCQLKFIVFGKMVEPPYCPNCGDDDTRLIHEEDR